MNPNWNNLVERADEPIVIVLAVIAIVWAVVDLRGRRKRRTVALVHPWVLRIGRRKIAEFDDKDEAMAHFIDKISERSS